MVTLGIKAGELGTSEINHPDNLCFYSRNISHAILSSEKENISKFLNKLNLFLHD